MQRNIFFEMDGKRMILIVNFLGRILVAFSSSPRIKLFDGVHGNTSFFSLAITLIKSTLAPVS